MFFLQMIVTLSMAGLETTFAYFAAKKADISLVQLGYIFMIMGFGSAIVQGGLVGRMTKKYGGRRGHSNGNHRLGSRFHSHLVFFRFLDI